MNFLRVHKNGNSGVGSLPGISKRLCVTRTVYETGSGSLMEQ